MQVLVMGAGSVGCYLGGLAAAAGLDVHFVGRPRVLEHLRRHGLVCSDLGGRQHTIPASALHLHERVPAGLQPSVSLLCVKSAATTEAARALQAALPAGSLLLSMQNGIGNADTAQAAAPGLDVRAGMVPFNVAELAPGHFHRGSTGALMVQGTAETDAPLRSLQNALARSGIDLQVIDSAAAMRAVQWGKLLLNLNNPVNALSGLPLREQLQQRGYRRCLAALQAEALDVLAAAGQPVRAMTPLPPRRLLSVLRLPTPLFKLVAARMLKIDAKARSSMADDLALGRRTEIDALCGEVTALARSADLAAPLNAQMQRLVHDWPARSRPYGPEELLAALGLN